MIVFTLCSNNYLALARILGESLLRHNPGIRFVIGLVDRVSSSVDYKALGPFEVLPISDVGMPDFDEMVLSYSIVELNTAVKPFVFRHLFARHSAEPDLKICYLDPDICVYAPLTEIEEALTRASILITPHTESPIAPDGQHPGENTFLNFGLYNLGFCGLRRSPSAERMVEWWASRTARHCHNDVANGFFVDQLWINLVPLFFEDVEISRHKGLNVAYWNLHERQVENRNGRWEVNQRWPLVFFHFSDLAMDHVDAITKVPTRITLKERAGMRPLFDEYRNRVKANRYQEFRAIPCAYVQQRNDWLQEQKRIFYRRHPLQFAIACLKKLVPRGFKNFVRRS